MYHMKSIIDHGEGVGLPKCMYHVRNLNETLKDEMNLDIHNQVMKFLKAPNNTMSELEHRQEVLIKKLDTLYDRIKTISSYCNGTHEEERNKPTCISAPEEVVLVVDSRNPPWFLNKIQNESSAPVKVSFHVHSSVPKEKVATLIGEKNKNSDESVKINFRVIIKNVSTDSELKLSSLAVPIIGTVNILRYLSYVYPKAIPYDDNDYQMDNLLDICHIIEKSSDRDKEIYVKQLFSKCKDWIYNNKYSVVDLAAFNVIRQSKSCFKLIPKQWFAECEKMCS